MFRIRTKLFLIIGIIVVIFSSFILYRTYEISNQHVHEVVQTHADMALQFDLSIREYIGSKVRPVMYELLGEEAFIPELMSTSFVARSIFDDVKNKFPDYILKFSSDDPRNPANQASPEELKFIDYFNKHPLEKTWNGRVVIDNKQYYAKFNARRMQEDCLHCHGNPADAPRSMIEQYGSTAGFNRPVGQVIALDTVAIPISKVQEQLQGELKNNFVIMGAALVLLFTALFVSVKFFVTDRLSFITKHLAGASKDDFAYIKPIDEGRSNDEISLLANSFNNLALKLNSYHSSLDQEILERKTIEERLIESKETLENVLDSSGPICITSTDFEVILANKAYYEIWPRSDVEKPVKCHESRPGSLCKSDSCPLNQITMGKETVTVDVKKYVTGGREYVFIVTARAFRTDGKLVGIVESFQDISERTKLENERARLIDELKQSLQKVKLLSGLIPICASCKSIRDDKGYWSQIEAYIRDHSEAEFSHGLCPQCVKKYYTDLEDMKKK